MNIDLNHLEKYREGNRLEAKEAQGGIPGSIWETYSSFANTNGGIILLGVTELPDKALKAIGLSDPDMLVKQFWDGFNNPQKVSINILSDKDVSILEIDGVRIIQINVPRADRHDRPVYIGPEPFKGSYRRNGEGDYHCRADEVRNMYRDQSDISMDTRTVSELGMDAFDMESVSGYRRRLELSKPNHVWLKLSDEHFLIKLGAADYGDDNKLHPTGAGILMFGEEYRIVREFTGYFLDYREVEPGQERWVNRFVSSSGDWSGNLFDFYFRAINRIAQIIPTPFKLNDEALRVDDTPVHKAMREVLANTLINADYYGRQGVVIIRGLRDVNLSNPGGFRIPINEAISGGHSDPRNITLMKMFNLLDIGERAGSGIPSIFSVWEEEGWLPPEIAETFAPERSTVHLSLFSADFLPENQGEKQGENQGEKMTTAQSEVFVIIEKNPTITTAEIADTLGLPPKTVSSRIKTLKDKNLVRRVGPDKGGHWEIISS